MTPFDIAKKHIGLKELPGVHAEPLIAAMFAKSGHPEVKSDEIAWCSAFVGACLQDAGIKGTQSLSARSYLKFGTPVSLKDAKPGDIVIFWRGSPTGWQGHVAFYDSQTDKMVRVLGGNQSNAVTYALYGKDRVLGVRRVPVTPPAGREVYPAPTPVTPGPALDPLTGNKHGGFWAAIIAGLLALLPKSISNRMGPKP